jgi:hypothetical protein
MSIEFDRVEKKSAQWKTMSRMENENEVYQKDCGYGGGTGCGRL